VPCPEFPKLSQIHPPEITKWSPKTQTEPEPFDQILSSCRIATCSAIEQILYQPRLDERVAKPLESRPLGPRTHEEDPHQFRALEVPAYQTIYVTFQQVYRMARGWELPL
jgi:hypothetical protein